MSADHTQLQAPLQHVKTHQLQAIGSTALSLRDDAEVPLQSHQNAHGKSLMNIIEYLYIYESYEHKDNSECYIMFHHDVTSKFQKKVSSVDSSTR